MIVFDANFLVYFLDPKLKDGVGKNLRVDHLVSTIQNKKDRIVIPTPALAELLVGAGLASSQYLRIIHESKFFRIEPFGERAAIEVAAMTRAAITQGNKRGAASADAPWAKVQIDRQIVAISRVVNARAIYSNDSDLVDLAIEQGISAYKLEDLPEPPSASQSELMFEEDQNSPDIPNDN
jgi:predicted nucleic acid-binding protein